MKVIPLFLSVSLISLSTSVAKAESNWFVRPYVGTSQMSDLSADFAQIEGLTGKADIDLDGGFTSGIGLGYRYNQNFAAEFGWEYRSNDSSVNLASTSQFDEGNYASNIFYLNGHYQFAKTGKWQPYVGAGLSWIQEIDIDLERDGEEFSYSGSGDVGYQVFAGVNYDLSEKWALQSEVRYGSISDIDLEPEGDNSGEFKGLDYDTTTFQIGVVYKF